MSEVESTHEASPSWSPGWSVIAFTSDRGGVPDVWLKDLLSGTPTRVTDQAYATLARLSPDGQRIAYFQDMSL